MASKTAAPNLSTSRWAGLGPMPLTMPLPRYLAMPSAVSGWLVQHLGPELLAVLGVHRPPPRRLDPLALMDLGGGADDGEQVAPPFHLHA